MRRGGFHREDAKSAKEDAKRGEVTTEHTEHTEEDGGRFNTKAQGHEERGGMCAFVEWRSFGTERVLIFRQRSLWALFICD